MSLVGVAVLGPVIAAPVTHVLGFPLRAAGMSGELATRNTQRNPKRTARTASSLTIGVALVVFIVVLSASVKTSFGGSVDTSFRGTHVIDAGFDGPGMSPKLADRLRSTGDVAAVAEARMSPAIVDGSQTDIFAFTADSIDDVFDLGHVTGRLDGLGADGMAVAADVAKEQHLRIGSTVPVTFPTGPSSFVVRAIYDGSTEWMGDRFVDVAAFDAHAPDQLDHKIYVEGDSHAVQLAAADYPNAEVLDRSEFLDQASQQIDQVIGVITALLALAVVIALLGIANTMALSVFERNRELGLLRAVGMHRSQVRSTIRWEAMMIALLGVTLGLGVGTFFGWATVRALADEGITSFSMPALTLVAITTIAVVAAGVAAAMPARRAARANVLEAVAAQ